MLTHTLMAILGAALAAGLLLAFYNPASGVSLPGGDAVPAPGPPAASPADGEQAIVTKVKPGLVIINTSLQYDSEAAAGTGMVINSGGLVLTNNHVIENSTKITATFVSTGRTYQATVLGYDQTGDIALIRLKNASGLTTVPIGNSASVAVGNAVVAMGNAEGQGAITAKPGQVTALDQTIGYPPFVGIFIGSGSSSSPQAQAQQEQQQNGGGSGGTGSAPQCSTSNAGLNVPSVIAPVSSGTLIIGTICGSPAASAGLTGGAVITAVNGHAVGSPDDLSRILSRFHPGDTISVTWVRPAGQRTTSSLHLTAGPPR